MSRRIAVAALLAAGSLRSPAADQVVRAAREAVAWASPGPWQLFTNNPVLAPGRAGSWDAGALGSMSVLRVGDWFHIYYEAWGVRGHSAMDYSTIQIGHALSRDGVHWTKDPANPVVPKGTGNDWDRNGTWDPFVLWENGIFKMWYGGGMDNRCDWGYAVSGDGVHFAKQGQISHLGDVEDDHVVHDVTSGQYYMYYWDRNHELKGLFRAQSLNETNFDFAHAEPIHIEGLPGNSMYKFTHVLQDHSQWHMFFGEFRPSGLQGLLDGLRHIAGRLPLAGAEPAPPPRSGCRDTECRGRPVLHVLRPSGLLRPKRLRHPVGRAQRQAERTR